jgi:hypothetical protein
MKKDPPPARRKEGREGGMEGEKKGWSTQSVLPLLLLHLTFPSAS